MVDVCLVLTGMLLAVYFLVGWSVGALRSQARGRPVGSVWAVLDLLVWPALVIVVYAITLGHWWKDGLLDPAQAEPRRMLTLALVTLAVGLRVARWQVLLRRARDGVPASMTS